MMAAPSSMLRMEAVTRVFHRGSGAVKALDQVSIGVERGESLGLIGESGSGKSTLGRLALGLQRPDGGRVLLGGQDLATIDAPNLRRLRARNTMVFQEPRESLNPRMTIGDIVAEPLIIHQPGLSRSLKRIRVADAMALVGLDAGYMNRRPHTLSGGQQQRVSIARAIVTEPSFVVLDEPTSALDVSVQAQVLTLLADLRQRLGLSYLFISHDIDCVAYLCSRVAVLYFGRLVELGPAHQVLTAARHPYTRALLASGLSADPDRPPLPQPDWADAAVGPSGWPSSEPPALDEVSPGHFVGVWPPPGAAANAG
jgi:peptide/nickel transport system ATP-binding protein